MTRKDYIILAKALSDALTYYQPPLACQQGVEAAAFRIADALQRDNPNFDRGRFLTAARVS